MSPRSIDCKADALTTTTSRPYLSQCWHKVHFISVLAPINVSYNFMMYLVPTLKHYAGDFEATKDMCCGRTKAAYLLTESLTVDIHEKLIRELQEAKSFFVLFDKACDILINKIFSINV